MFVGEGQIGGKYYIHVEKNWLYKIYHPPGYFEYLQDKLNQIRGARAALNATREVHGERKRREAEEAQRFWKIQMAQKLEIMRKKKEEYLEVCWIRVVIGFLFRGKRKRLYFDSPSPPTSLQYQRQMAMQQMQEQDQEMKMRQEQQKHAYEMVQPQMTVPYPLPHVPTTIPFHSGMSICIHIAIVSFFSVTEARRRETIWYAYCRILSDFRTEVKKQEWVRAEILERISREEIF